MCSVNGYTYYISKGKRGGGRVITCLRIVQETGYLLAIYDKAERDSVSENELDDMLADAGLQAINIPDFRADRYAATAPWVTLLLTVNYQFDFEGRSIDAHQE